MANDRRQAVEWLEEMGFVISGRDQAEDTNQSGPTTNPPDFGFRPRASRPKPAEISQDDSAA